MLLKDSLSEPDWLSVAHSLSEAASSLSKYKTLENVELETSALSTQLARLVRTLSFLALSVEAKLHDESRLIQRCFDDNKDGDKGDDKKLKGQSKNEFKMFKIESRTLQDSRGKLKNTSRFKRKVDFKNQESRFKDQASKNQDQNSRLKIQESREDLIKISMKRFFQKLSSTWIFLKTCLPKSFYSLVIDYQIIVIDY